jgi:hypothetical protein
MAAIEEKELPSRSSADTNVDLEKGEPRPDVEEEEVVAQKVRVYSCFPSHQMFLT